MSKLIILNSPSFVFKYFTRNDPAVFKTTRTDFHHSFRSHCKSNSLSSLSLFLLLLPRYINFKLSGEYANFRLPPYRILITFLFLSLLHNSSETVLLEYNLTGITRTECEKSERIKDWGGIVEGFQLFLCMIFKHINPFPQKSYVHCEAHKRLGWRFELIPEVISASSLL